MQIKCKWQFFGYLIFSFSLKLCVTRRNILSLKMVAAIRPLSDDLKKVAEEELNEVESRIPDDVAVLREWLEKQPHLSTCTDDQFLVTFLRGCKYSLEKAKSKLDYFYTIQAALPEIFANKRIDDKCIRICRTGTLVRLPKPLGIGGPRIFLTDYSKLDLNKFTLIDLFRYQLLIMYAQSYEDDNLVVSGFLQLIDLSKMNLAFILHFDPVVLKKLSIFLDKAQPTRLKGWHIINYPNDGHFMLLSRARSLMSEKLQKRFHLHKTLDDLYKVVPKEYLPIEYGGTNGCIADIQADTERRLLGYNKYFLEDDKYGVDEKLRPGKVFNANLLFGIEGSFRKLEID